MNTDKTLDERIEDFVSQGNYYWEESKNRYWAKTALSLPDTDPV